MAILTAQLQGVIINNSGTDDQLVSVTTSAAKSVSLYSSSADAAAASIAATATPAATASTATTAAGSDSASPSASASASDSASASASSSAAAGSQVTIPAGQLVHIGGSADAAVIELNDLSSQIVATSIITLTFTFAHAGSVTVKVGVALGTNSGVALDPSDRPGSTAE